MRFSILYLSVFALWLASFGYSAAQSRQLDDLVVYTESGVRPIAVIAEDAELQPLLQRAFSLHGAFRLTSVAEAAYTFRFQRVDNSRVRLIIESGRPAQTLLSQEIRGESIHNAALRAADLAVLKTTGAPGFFGGKLAFVGERTGKREIYTADLFFQNVQQLTRDNNNSVFPRWSPDGNRLLYTGYFRTGFPDIFQIDLNSGRRSTFASYQGTNTGAVFSPDGRQVAMILSSSGNPELYISDASGRNPRRLTRNNDVEATPTWASDGRRLIVVSDRLGGPQLFEIQAQGGAMQRVPTNISGYCAEPNWNQVDANQVLFTAAVRNQFQLAVFDFSTRESRFLTSGADSHVEGVWLNDGRHLICTLRRAHANQLWLIDSITGKKNPLHSAEFGSTSQGSFVYPQPPR